MRNWLFSVVLSLAPFCASAQESYEALMQSLASAQSQVEAERLNAKIWEHWLTAPDDVAQELVTQAQDRRNVGDYAGAIAILDRLVDGWPDYAEAWNQRATVFFLAQDYPRSLADVDEVLAREPRHFGALSGKGLIHLRLGQPALAELAIREALKHHPFLNERFLLPQRDQDL